MCSESNPIINFSYFPRKFRFNIILPYRSQKIRNISIWAFFLIFVRSTFKITHSIYFGDRGQQEPQKPYSRPPPTLWALSRQDFNVSQATCVTPSLTVRTTGKINAFNRFTGHNNHRNVSHTIWLISREQRIKYYYIQNWAIEVISGRFYFFGRTRRTRTNWIKKKKKTYEFKINVLMFCENRLLRFIHARQYHEYNIIITILQHKWKRTT